MNVSLHVLQHRNSKKYLHCFVHPFTLQSCEVISHKIICNALWYIHLRAFEYHFYCTCIQRLLIRKVSLLKRRSLLKFKCLQPLDADNRTLLFVPSLAVRAKFPAWYSIKYVTGQYSFFPLGHYPILWFA